jgi:hypothetical protein
MKLERPADSGESREWLEHEKKKAFVPDIDQEIFAVERHFSKALIEKSANAPNTEKQEAHHHPIADSFQYFQKELHFFDSSFSLSDGEVYRTICLLSIFFY